MRKELYPDEKCSIDDIISRRDNVTTKDLVAVLGVPESLIVDYLMLKDAEGIQK